jgi:hypothetical protein
VHEGVQLGLKEFRALEMRIDDLQRGNLPRADACGNFCDAEKRRPGHKRNRESMRELVAGQARSDAGEQRR